MATPTLTFAQVASNIPAGSPLGASDISGAEAEAAQAEAQAAMRARVEDAARARASARAMAAAFAPASQPAVVDEGRTRPTASTYGQVELPSHAAPSPYGGTYQIRTPWDRR